MVSEKHPRRWPARLGAVAGGLGVIVFVAAFFVVPGPMINTAARVGPGMAFAEVDGRGAVIISYFDSSYSGLGFWVPSTHEGRVAAIDLETGASLWDRGIGEAFAETTVLAAGSEYVYLRGSFDLFVIDLDDGSIVARGTDIAGLEDFEVFQAEIIYSPAQDAIMLRERERDGAGTDNAVRKIVIDTQTAVEVDEPTQSTWECVLDWHDFTYFYETPEPVLSRQGRSGAESLGFGLPKGSAPGTPGERMIQLRGDGSSTAIGSETFVAPSFVAESILNEPVPYACPTASWRDDVFPLGETSPDPLGADSGFAVIEHDMSARDDDRAISIVDTSTGELLGTNAAEWGMTHARNAPNGGAVLIVDRFLPGVLPGLSVPVTSVLLLVGEDGAMNEIILAEHGWFGLPW